MIGHALSGVDFSAMPILLEVIDGPHQGRRFEFDGRENFVVGRASVAHFRLTKDDRHISRVHFMIELNPPFCRLVDMGSRNGTFLNGNQVQTSLVKHGDLIRAGRTTMRMTLNPRKCPPGSDSTRSYIAEPPLPANESGFDLALADGVQASPVTDDGRTEKQAAPELPRLPGYGLEAELGRGGMGVVYLARRTVDGRQVAVKTIQPAAAGVSDEVERFLREARVLSELRHPNIVRFHEINELEGLLYFVMEYVPGTDAMQALHRDGPMEISRAARLLCDALDALDFAHARGYVHRDVKPSNLLLDGERGYEACKLADFGLAKAYNSSPLSGVTMMEGAGGTVPYMPPEQITSYRDAKPPADQYSAAATLYHMMTGQFIFDFGDLPIQERMGKILLEDPLPICQRRPDTPAPLAEAIHKALAKDPANRHPSAGVFRHAILPFA